MSSWQPGDTEIRMVVEVQVKRRLRRNFSRFRIAMGGNYHRKVSNKYRTRNWWREIDFWGTDKINLQLQKSEHHSNTVKRAWADLMFVGSLRKSERTLRARFFLRSPWVPGDGQQIWKALSQKEDCQLKYVSLLMVTSELEPGLRSGFF